jgi:hypothetical protein
MYKYMSLVSKIKEVMKQELEDNPELTDKEYEELFVKYYMHYMDESNLTVTTPQNRKKNGLR